MKKKKYKITYAHTSLARSSRQSTSSVRSPSFSHILLLSPSSLLLLLLLESTSDITHRRGPRRSVGRSILSTYTRRFLVISSLPRAPFLFINARVIYSYTHVRTYARTINPVETINHTGRGNFRLTRRGVLCPFALAQCPALISSLLSRSRPRYPYRRPYALKISGTFTRVPAAVRIVDIFGTTCHLVFGRSNAIHVSRSVASGREE